MVWTLPAATTGALLVGLVFAPAASAADSGSIVPLAFLGIELPSLHSIIEGIAKGFFGALAHALVPSWLTHGTVATIQHLVALPDPATWTHVGQLQADMVWLGASLLPVTLAIGTVRYWLVGLTGSAHPAGALGRCVWVTFVLVAYRWFVEQTVAITNTMTHAILGFPVVASGLQRIIGVLFGGALLGGAGGVFGAFLVIVGVLFAAGLFAVQVLLTVLLALLIVAGPPLIALSAIPELSHLARTWAHALMAITLVPLGWTVLFATAGALCLDATSFTGGAGGVPGHVAAAFAGLITFAIAVKLPLMLLGELRHLFGSAFSSGGGGSSGQSTMPGAERVKAAHARLRSAAFEGVPSVGRSAGRAAGALGAPAGGPLGAARRGLTGAARRSGVLPGAAAGVAGGAVAGKAAGRDLAQSGRRGIRERLRNAGAIIASAPSDARAAMAAGARKAGRTPHAAGAARAAGRGPRGTGTSTGKTPASVAGGSARGRGSSQASPASRQRTQGPVRAPSPRTQTPVGRSPSARSAPTPNAPGGTHPGRKVATGAQREASGGTRPPSRAANAPTPPPPPVRAKRPAKRKPRPRSGS
ncbi:MAG TPA: hypothetical protein VMF09_10410 [Solirubrobacteraceae bacterium]|nr:hypothetical protein [Solirubrobacteraceae bacterium]